MSDPDTTSNRDNHPRAHNFITVLELPHNLYAEASEPLAWTAPGPNLWVATRSGEFAGFVEFNDGLYLVTDELGRALPAAATLNQAKSSLDSTSAESPRRVYLAVLKLSAVAVPGIAVVALCASLGFLHS